MINQENVPATRSGLSSLYKLATDTCRLLVVSRVSNQKVLPWMVSSTGAIRCYDTVSLSQKLSLHRHTRVPILLHVFLWDRSMVNSSGGSNRFRALSPSALQPLPSEVQIGRFSNETHTLPLPPEASDPTDITSEVSQSRFERDTAGESSFRFHDFSLSSNWVWYILHTWKLWFCCRYCNVHKYKLYTLHLICRTMEHIELKKKNFILLFFVVLDLDNVHYCTR